MLVVMTAECQVLGVSNTYDVFKVRTSLTKVPVPICPYYLIIVYKGLLSRYNKQSCVTELRHHILEMVITWYAHTGTINLKENIFLTCDVDDTFKS